VLVYEAVTGETVLSVLPHVVVMEMKQPDMFGIEVLNLIKIQMDRQTPVDSSGRG